MTPTYIYIYIYIFLLSPFSSILEWLPQLVSWDHLLGKLFSNLLLWGSVCLCHWGTFPVCSKMLGPMYLSSLLVYVFLLSWLLLRDIKEKWLLLPVIFVVRGRIMFVWVYWKITFLLFLGHSFPSCVGVFHLLSFVELDLWKDTV